MFGHGHLSSLFRGVGVKRLAAVDADSDASNQHEVTGSKPLSRILGDEDRKLSKDGADNRFPATYIWLGGEQEAISEEGELSWYDSRRNHITRSEWRLYYQSNSVTLSMRPGDLLFVARRQNDHLLFIVTPSGSTIQRQLFWLFGLSDEPDSQFSVREIGKEESSGELDFAARYILDELGIEPEESNAEQLDALLRRFGNKFPTTKEFSELARSSLPDLDPRDDADQVLMAWLEQEELLFRRLERRIVDERLRSGFVSNDLVDIDGFLSFSLSVQNRRKSRAGHSLENHLEKLFQANGVRFARGAETENRNKPDFLFPGQAEYRDATFPIENLTMLGAKSTLKDRWRQVLNEASRIKAKHLITLEPGISPNQTEQMRLSSLQLVLPEKLHDTFQPAQKSWLMNLKDFLRLVTARQ